MKKRPGPTLLRSVETPATAIDFGWKRYSRAGVRVCFDKSGLLILFYTPEPEGASSGSF